MNYISIPNVREARRSLRMEKRQWQTAALGLLVLSTAVNAAQCAAVWSLGRQAADWEAKYQAAVAIERDAIAAYGGLLRETELEKQARQEQAEAYEAIGAWEYIGTCTVTAYCACEECCGEYADGLTATGLPVREGIVAVDPDVIPLGSTIIMDGVKYLAADTGVTGNHIDIYMPHHKIASAFGNHWQDVWMMRP